MKFYEKYENLRHKDVVTEQLIASILGTMALENQAVPEPQVRALVIALLREAELSGREFVKNHAGQRA